MKAVFYAIVLFSKLPLKVLYFISDILYVLIFHIAGYRKNVVMENLKNSFPEKKDAELKEICKNFYKNFSDYLVETAKSFTVSADELKVRVQHINRDLFEEAHANGKNIILLTGHVFNWEWFTALATMVPQEHCYPVYRKMQNPFWNEKIKNIRNAHGNEAVEAEEVIKHIFRNKNDGNSIYMFVADQTPHVALVDYGLKFLNQKTPAFIGYDKLATRMDFVFLYCDMKKVKRGFYQVNYYRIMPEGEKFVENEVVRKFHKLLENTINKRPDNYLWSHRKWKNGYAIKRFDETDLKSS